MGNQTSTTPDEGEHSSSPSTTSTSVRVTGLWVYPVKSCHGIAVEEGHLNRYGFVHDREWMVVTEQLRNFHRSFVTIRQIPRMTLITTSFQDEHLCLDAPGMATLRIPLAYSAEHDKPVHEKVRLWRETVPVVDEGSEAAEWLSTFLQKPLRLVRMIRDFPRKVDPDWAVSGVENVTSLTDAHPFLLISEESHADLVEKARKIAEDKGENPIEIAMKRFRPNIVVRGAEKPFAEDQWTKIRIGGIEFHGSQPCERCMLPRVDPETGEMNKIEPTRTLTSYRAKDGRHYFGRYFLHGSNTGSIKVGQEVELLSVADQSIIDSL